MKFSDQDFDDHIETELRKHPLGEIAIKSYVPIREPGIDGLPTDENAFVVSYEQRGDGPGKLAHTRIDIRGANGLICQSYEVDHVAFGRVDELLSGPSDPENKRTIEGQELLAEVIGIDPVTRQQVAFAKGTILSKDDIAELERVGVTKVPTRLRDPAEVAAIIAPLLAREQPVQTAIDPDGRYIMETVAAEDLAVASAFHKAMRADKALALENERAVARSSDLA